MWSVCKSEMCSVDRRCLQLRPVVSRGIRAPKSVGAPYCMARRQCFQVHWGMKGLRGPWRGGPAGRGETAREDRLLAGQRTSGLACAWSSMALCAACQWRCIAAYSRAARPGPALRRWRVELHAITCYYTDLHVPLHDITCKWLHAITYNYMHVISCNVMHGHVITWSLHDHYMHVISCNLHVISCNCTSM